MVKVAPSLLAGNFVRMEDSVHIAEAAGCDLLHCDVMDGMFVPNISFGFQMIEEVSRIASVPLDVHLMIEQPERYVERFAEAGAGIITFHVEATAHVQRTLQMIHACGVRAGVVLNPATPIEYVRYVLDDVDMVLLMTVNPGYGGQKFIPASLQKITELRQMMHEHGKAADIEVDGGISSENADIVVRAGANVLVAGSAFFGSKDPASELAAMKRAGKAAP